MAQTTAITKQANYKTVVRSASNEIIADEPIDLGGTDQGMNPAELLTASLGSCTSITLRMYADRKAWNLEEIIVEVFLNEDDKDNPVLTRIIEAKGDLDEKQKSRLLTIANACPMHKLLSRGIQIVTELKNN